MSTRKCPKCGNMHLGLMRSQNLKFCPDCDTWIKWELTPGQKPLIQASRNVHNSEVKNGVRTAPPNTNP